MWFVFPQLKALGPSSMATFFGIENLEEAIAYWRHPLLGARLKHCRAGHGVTRQDARARSRGSQGAGSVMPGKILITAESSSFA